MKKKPAIAIVGTFDSKAEEHFFLKQSIEQRGLRSLTINVGTRGPSPSPVSIDFFDLMQKSEKFNFESRDKAIAAMISVAKKKNISALSGREDRRYYFGRRRNGNPYLH
jgi:uncharacterized protein (UPF0261 family)